MMATRRVVNTQLQLINELQVGVISKAAVEQKPTTSRPVFARSQSTRYLSAVKVGVP